MILLIFLLLSTAADISLGTYLRPRFILESSPTFDNGRNIGTVDSPEIKEASGLAASRKHPSILYTHNDHGDRNRIFALDATTAHVIAVLEITNAAAHDWEDLAVGPCHGSKTCIYTADTGNAEHGARNIIYRVLEPDTIQNGSIPIDARLHFTWNAQDCETLMVDPSGEVYIISKVDGGKGLIAHVPSSGWDSVNTVQISSNAHLSISTSHQDPVGGDISPSGDEILIKTLDSVLYWDMNGSKNYVRLDCLIFWSTRTKLLLGNQMDVVITR